jgi:hypothetical protein
MQQVMPRSDRSHRSAERRPVAAALPSAQQPARVAYFVASHVNPDQVLRLIRALRTGSGDGSRVVIHHDYGVSNLDRSAVSRLGPNVDLLWPPAKVKYATFSTCRLILNVMRWLCEHREFDWMVYLSGQDYPVTAPAEIERSLAASSSDAYLEARPASELVWDVGPERYLYRYYDLPAVPGCGRLRAAVARHSLRVRAAGRLPRVHVAPSSYGPLKIGLRPSAEPFTRGFTCYKGSAWWTISRRAVEHVLAFVQANPRFIQHYARALYAANESFFQTILLNDPGLNVHSRDNKRFIRWSNAQSGHPDVLGEEHFGAIVESGAHFARKIDQRVSPRLLDLIDHHIGAKAEAVS